MLDVNYIDYLYAELPPEKRKELLKQLFGGAKQSINYFKKVKDPGLSKLEVLADFYNVPIDSLRINSKLRRMPYANEEDIIYNAITILSARYDEYEKQNPKERISLKDYLANDLSDRINNKNLSEILNRESCK